MKMYIVDRLKAYDDHIHLLQNKQLCYSTRSSTTQVKHFSFIREYFSNFYFDVGFLSLPTLGDSICLICDGDGDGIEYWI